MPEIDLSTLGVHAVKMLAAYVLAVPLGWEREGSTRGGAGLRTFPLVAVGSCAYLLIGLDILEGSESHARLLYGLMTGIGFIGGGSILKDGAHGISGTATAASIWNTGAMGAAVAWGRYEIAILLSLFSLATLRLIRPLKRVAGQASASEERE